MILQVGVKILLKNPAGKYLLVQRSLEKYPDIQGSWDVVGGRINIGTPLLENLAREVKEEVGLHVIGTPRLIHAQDIIRNTEKHVVRLSYVGAAEGDPVLDKNENVAYKWVTLEELKAHPDLDVYLQDLLRDGYLVEDSFRID